MRKGDLAFFYHSSCAVPGVAGIVEITREAFADPTQFDPGSGYHDPASKADNPRWSCVEVTFRRKLERVITLQEIRAQAGRLQGLALLSRGRLSVMPVEPAHWELILSLRQKDA
jgi:predicted RNA-binding protein with PUA-like domain